MKEEKNNKENDKNKLMENIVSLCKRRGFIFQGSEIYGGLSGTYDWAHFGVALKNNIKQNWWKKFVDSRRDMYGIDAAILMNQKVWEASGHVAGFADPMIECKSLDCGFRERLDKLFEASNLSLQDSYDLYIKSKFKETEIKSKKFAEYYAKIKAPKEKDKIDRALRDLIEIDAVLDIKDVLLDLRENNINWVDEYKKDPAKYMFFVAHDLVKEYKIVCPKCKKENFAAPKNFNMMFATKVGAVEDSSATSYLRPETAQGIFVNFKNTVDAFHPKLPFGMAQIGKAFRNEITPRDFLFRQREFEQMEIEYFIRPADWEKYFEYWRGEMLDWMEELGLDMAKVHEIDVPDADRAHYSKKTIDFEFDFPFGQKELFGLAYRTDFDLKTHKLEYIDEENKEKMVPHVIEPSMGVDRAILALLISVYAEDEKDGEMRSYLKFKPNIAPVICAVSPLLKNKPELVEYANTRVYAPLKAEFGRVAWDDNGNIGKRYRRQDEIGTPFCIVVDFDTLTDDTVTVRDRDTGEQERVKVENLESYIKERIS
ncbi:MAG TPA: glycine--tRNA ligase [Candidatus Paceibacterota bacterium]|jgi:glycyl-tRNA synthetase|nr:glycine--tRNA ligase [Candidatus Paceibacterota bacterium]